MDKLPVPQLFSNYTKDRPFCGVKLPQTPQKYIPAYHVLITNLCNFYIRRKQAAMETAV